MGLPADLGRRDPKPSRLLRIVEDSTVDLDDLLVQVGRGDRLAFDRLYDALAPVVYGVARRVVRDVGMAEEITQEVLVEVWRQAPRFDPAKGRAASWVVTIAHRRAVDRVRSEQSRRDRDQREALGAVPAAIATGDEITAGLDAAADAERVTAGIATLTGNQREAIRLAFFDGRTHREIAEHLGLPLGTVKTRIRDGLVRLRDAIGSPEVTCP